MSIFARKGHVITLGGNSSGSEPKGILVGILTNGDHFPTKRPDGSELQNEDFVKIKSTTTFPCVIDGVTFNSSKDIGLYYKGTWSVDPGIIQDTDETPLSKPEEESLSGTANNQYQLNKEIKNALSKTYVHDQIVASKEWRINHKLNGIASSVIVYDETGEIIGGLDYHHIDNNNAIIYFGNDTKGRCIIKI